MAPYETQVQQREREQCVGVGIGAVGVGWMIQHNMALLLKQLVIRHYAEAPIQSAFKYISVRSLICIHFSHYI